MTDLQSPTSTFTLNNGVEMPVIGLGVYQSAPEDTAQAVEAALRAGYRLIDTAAAYENEREVGQGLRDSGVSRDEVFLETKVWINDFGREEAIHAFDKAAGKLQVEQLDLLILHQAFENDFERTVRAYQGLEQLLADGKVRAIGVSNFEVRHLEQLMERTEVVPAVNQIELHPYFARTEVEQFGREHGILTQAWSPIGGITSYGGDGTRTSTFDDPQIARIAEAHGRTPAQVMLRWQLQRGRQVIPKSVTPERIRENLDVFGFELSDDELRRIDALDTGERGGPEPHEVTLEDFGKEIPEA